MLVSVIHQHESATTVQISPPNGTSISPPTPSRPSRLLQSAGFEFPYTANPYLLSNFTHGNMHFSRLLSQFVLPPPSPATSTSLFCMSVSLFLPFFFSSNKITAFLFWMVIRKGTFGAETGLQPSFSGLELVSFCILASSVTLRKTWLWLNVVLWGLDLDRDSG